MLQAFRKNRYSLGKKLLLGFLILIFALFFGSFAGGMFSQVRPVADIDCHRFLLGQNYTAWMPRNPPRRGRSRSHRTQKGGRG
jgi:hypothetical protein